MIIDHRLMPKAEFKKESFDLIKKWTAKHRPAAEPDHQVERYAWLRDHTEGLLLSIGCGEAKNEEYTYINESGAVDYHHDIKGVDINPEFIYSARERWPWGEFRVKDICKYGLDLIDNSMDTVVLGDVIEHIKPFYFHKILSEALRVLKPGKHVLLTFPNGSYFGELNAESIYSFDHSLVVTAEVISDLLCPDMASRDWWLRSGGAKHNFQYCYALFVSPSKRFLFVDIINTKKEG